MSWLFSQALVEEYSEANCLETESFAQLNVMPTPHKFWCNGKMIESLDHSRFGLTLQVLTESRGEELLMSYRRAFHAKTYPVQEKGQGSTESAAGFGHKSSALLAKWSQKECVWKTAQCSLLADSGEFSQTWPSWGLMLNGECYQLNPLVHHTSAQESGFSLPTPSGCRSGKNHVAGRLDEWGGSSNPWRGTEIGKISSPDFEEWIMGWPERWTVLTPLGMDKFQLWRQKHGGFLNEHG